MLAAGALASAVLIGTPSAQAAAGPTVITVNPADSEGYINPNIFGVIFNWFYNAAGTYDPDTQQWLPQFVSLAKQAGLTSIRFFGGTLAGDTTLWTDGIGPVASRPETRTDRGGPGQVMVAGPDAFGQFINQIGGDGNAIVNMDESAEYAAQYVAYLTTPVSAHPSANPDDPSYWAALRAKNGHPAPYQIPVFDIGNEISLFSDNGAGWATGTPVAIGPHTTQCPAGGEHDCLYAFGGTSHFDNQPTIGRADTSSAASVSTGQAGQAFYAAYAPVQPRSQTVYVAGTAWTEVTSLAAASPAAKVYTIDDSTGEITFGNGTHGAVPPTGSQVTMSYNSGPHDGFIEYYQKMKQVNPNIKVCAEDLQPNFLAAMGSTYRYDCIGDHTGLSNGFPSTSLSDANFVQQLMSAPQAQYTALQTDQALVDSYAGRHVPIIPSAYGHAQNNYPPDDPQEHQQVADGILQARQLQNFIALDIPQANKFMMAGELFAPNGGPADYNSQGANINGLFQSDGQGHFAAMPSALAMGLLSRLGGQTQVGASVADNEPVALPDGTSIPALTVTAGKGRGGAITIAVVNCDMTSAVQASVSLGSLSLVGQASVSTMSGASPFATNTPTDPNQVAVTTSTQRVSGPALTHLFPAHSVTVITVKTR